MKLFRLFVCLGCLLAFSACKQRTYDVESDIRQLDKLVTNLEQKQNLTEEDIEQVEATIDGLHIDDYIHDLTEEQAEEYGRIIGRFAKVAVKQGMKEVNNSMDLVNGLLKGLSDEFNLDDEDE